MHFSVGGEMKDRTSDCSLYFNISSLRMIYFTLQTVIIHFIWMILSQTKYNYVKIHIF